MTGRPCWSCGKVTTRHVCVTCQAGARWLERASGVIVPGVRVALAPPVVRAAIASNA